MSSVADITPLIEAKLAQMGLELFSIKYHQAGVHSLLRISIDKEGGVTVDDCEAASTEISVLLDVENFSTMPYRLEVASPGADRPLTTEKDFRRSRGRRVKLDIQSETGALREVGGTVADCALGKLILNTESGVQEFPLSAIKRAKTELSFK